MYWLLSPRAGGLAGSPRLQVSVQCQAAHLRARTAIMQVIEREDTQK